MMGSNHEAFWSEEDRALCEALRSSPSGLTSAESSERLRQFGPNALDTRREATWWRAVWSQVRSPITLLLIFTAGLSFVLHEATEATMILVIIVVSTALGIWQERGASKTLEKLLAMVQSRSSVWRDGQEIGPTQEAPVRRDGLVGPATHRKHQPGADQAARPWRDRGECGDRAESPFRVRQGRC